jgi:hypothetical protein
MVEVTAAPQPDPLSNDIRVLPMGLFFCPFSLTFLPIAILLSVRQSSKSLSFELSARVVSQASTSYHLLTLSLFFCSTSLRRS